MKINLLTSAALFVGLSLAQSQDSQPPQFGEGGRRGPGRGGFPGSVGFTLLDANNDGVLDAQEIDGAPAVLAKLDKNSDGQVSADEVRPAFPAGRERGGPGGDGRVRGGPEGGAAANVVEDMVKTLMAFDANGDGKLSKNELPERMRGMFDRADENKDGFLTSDEIRKLAAAQSAPADPGSPGGRGREGRRGDGPDGRPARDMNFIRMDPVLAAVDTNGDGVLSAEEIRKAPNSIRKLDIDGDGKVTREELMTAARRLRETDQNH